MTIEAVFKPQDFRIDLSEEVFHGYSDGDTWNGFACPYFDYNEAVRVLNTLGNKWEYNEEQKVFTVFDLDDDEGESDPVEYEMVELFIDGICKEAYGIGAYFWIWDLVEI